VVVAPHLDEQPACQVRGGFGSLPVVKEFQWLAAGGRESDDRAADTGA
jgi:hypothetical protein